MSKDSEAKKLFSPDLSLTLDQQDLLRTALSSNRPSATVGLIPNASVRVFNSAKPSVNRSNNIPKQAQRNPDSSTNVSRMRKSPLQVSPRSGAPGKLDDSPLIDSEYDDTNFDWDSSGDALFGSLPGNLEGDDNDIHDKRKNPGGEEDEEGSGGKRQEGEDKTAKRPGRKPLTGGEPTTVSHHQLG